MAAKTVLRDPKAPLLFLRNSFLAAVPPKTAAPTTQIIQSIHAARPETQKPLLDHSGLSRYLYKESSKVDGVGLGGVKTAPLGTGDSSFGVQAMAYSDDDDDDDDDDNGTISDSGDDWSVSDTDTD